MNVRAFDFVVVGSGLAGSVAAYLLEEIGSVALVTKMRTADCNSYYAQGGIAIAAGALDSPENHYRDTLLAGDGFCDPDAVRLLTSRAPAVLDWLLSIGMDFDRGPDGAVLLGMEGAHSKPRILHAGGDATGAVLMRRIHGKLQTVPGVQIIEHTRVIGLLEEDGAVYGAEVETPESCFLYGRRATILATGGAGQLYPYTTNPQVATGDGLYLAHQAGALLRDMEFIQFHPTALEREGNPRVLISEAVRGAGAVLVNQSGERVMADHPQADLASRDVVARAIYRQMQDGNRVCLDTREIKRFADKFPTIHRACLDHDIDPQMQPVPVAPAAHFMMGGVAAQMDGYTGVRGLFAIGEVANTGVHGANRLAGNSLLECLAMAHELRAHMQMEEVLPERGLMRLTKRYGSCHKSGGAGGVVEPNAESALFNLRGIIWKSAGIIRNKRGLQEGLDSLQMLAEQFPRSPSVSVATWILESALLREESRGAHYRDDFPEHKPEWQRYHSEIGSLKQPEAADLRARKGERISARWRLGLQSGRALRKEGLINLASIKSVRGQEEMPSTYMGLAKHEWEPRLLKAKKKLGDDLLILGHHYQRDDVIRFAHMTGDSLRLARMAALNSRAKYVVFCGVYFMAETADILTLPHQQVILPDLSAGCSMADMADDGQVAECWAQIQAVFSGVTVPIAYVNSSAGSKAFCGSHAGAVCTSSNAKKVLTWALERGKHVLFFPDEHLGRNTALDLGIEPDKMVVWNQSKSEMEWLPGQKRDQVRIVLWKGFCAVHQRFQTGQIDALREEYPGIKILVHPECSHDVVAASDMCGSTEYIIEQVESGSPGSIWAIGTEINLVHRLAERHAEKKILSLDPDASLCPTMRRINPQNLLWSLENLLDGVAVNVVSVNAGVAESARLALDQMLTIG
jgi:L-aspartate oxidase/quinolinate synthetase A subunit